MHPWIANEAASPTHFRYEHARWLFGSLAFYFVAKRVVAAPLSGLSATYRGLDPFGRQQWVSRVISLLHACVALVVSWRAVAGLDCYRCAESVVHLSTDAIDFAMAHSGGYLFHDLVDILLASRWYGKLDGGPLVFAHHACGVLGYALAMAYKKAGYVWVVYILTEVTTPFLNGVFFFEKMGRQNLRTACGVLLLLSYAPTRILLSPLTLQSILDHWVHYRSLPELYFGWLMSMLALATTFNYFWFYKILVGCLKGLGLMKSKAKRR
mmetsp:Transcript_8594/g.25850  ORF Transcript_8594/g.25850 Transcript_8594/m.25850 type:complete len:267 (+) Transcript_8594:168-968(+)